MPAIVADWIAKLDVGVIQRTTMLKRPDLIYIQEQAGKGWTTRTEYVLWMIDMLEKAYAIICSLEYNTETEWRWLSEYESAEGRTNDNA